LARDPGDSAFRVSETALMWIAIAVITALVLIQGWAIVRLYGQVPAVPGGIPASVDGTDWDPAETTQ